LNSGSVTAGVPSAVQMELKMALAVCVTLRRRNRSMGFEPLAERPLSSGAYVSNGSICALREGRSSAKSGLTVNLPTAVVQ